MPISIELLGHEDPQHVQAVMAGLVAYANALHSAPSLREQMHAHMLAQQSGGAQMAEAANLPREPDMIVTSHPVDRAEPLVTQMQHVTSYPPVPAAPVSAVPPVPPAPSVADALSLIHI